MRSTIHVNHLHSTLLIYTTPNGLIDATAHYSLSKQWHHRVNAFYTSVWYKPQHNLQTTFSWLLNSATPRSCNPRDNKKPLSYSSELYSTPSRLPKSPSGRADVYPIPDYDLSRRVFGLPSPDGSRVMAV